MENIFDTSRRHKVKVEFDNGDTIKTEISGTPSEIVAYYIGKPHNLGRTDDNIAIGRKIWFFDGEKYLQHHRIFREVYKSKTCRVVDHGDQVGLEFSSVAHDGSKYFVDARRKQVLAMTGPQYEQLLKKEF